jgi:hypothetical protein
MTNYYLKIQYIFYVWLALNPVSVLSVGSYQDSCALCNLAGFVASP